jgi:hypothetical protein
MIQRKIDSLSNDEDCRQDLWISYLEDPYLELSGTLTNIQDTRKIDDLIVQNLITNITVSPTNETMLLLDSFTELERSVMILLILGLTKEQISRYKMIEMLRLQQMINNISAHPAWENLLAKEKTKC